MSKPITPEQASKLKQSVIPDFVIDAFNDAITKNLRDGSARVLQKDVVAAIKAKAPEDFEMGRLFSENMLDVEPLFRAAGWRVDYDKPGYCETYDAFFVFQSKRKTTPAPGLDWRD